MENATMIGRNFGKLVVFVRLEPDWGWQACTLLPALQSFRILV